MIAFENKGIAALQRPSDSVRDVPDIGQQAKPSGTIGKYKLTGLLRIVRNGEWMQLDVAHGKGFMIAELLNPDPVVDARPQHPQGSCGQPQRHAMLAGEGRSATGVIIVFVGQDYCRDIGWRDGATRQATFQLADGEATIDQYKGLLATDNEGIPPAAAAENGEAQSAASLWTGRLLVIAGGSQGADSAQLQVEQFQQFLGGLASIWLTRHVTDTDHGAARRTA